MKDASRPSLQALNDIVRQFVIMCNLLTCPLVRKMKYEMYRLISMCSETFLGFVPNSSEAIILLYSVYCLMRSNYKTIKIVGFIMRCRSHFLQITLTSHGSLKVLAIARSHRNTVYSGHAGRRT